MNVQLGNPAPVHAPNGVRAPLPGPAVTYLSIPDVYEVTPEFDVSNLDTTLPRHPAELTLQIAQNGVLLTHAPGHEAFIIAVAAWTEHSSVAPTWVSSDNDELARQLADWYDCPVGAPDDVEATHHTDAGPPGVGA